MNGFLLDTNCISEIVRPKPEPRVIEWMEAADENLLYLSVLTLGEIRRSVAGLPHGLRKTRLEAWLEVDLPERFEGRIVSIDRTIADGWGLLAADARREGKGLSVVDGLLAATALHYDLTLVSRNTLDFHVTHARLLNPWQG